MSDEGVAVTAFLTAVMMFITERYGPVAAYNVANRYLRVVCRNDPYIAVSNVPSLVDLHGSFDDIKAEAADLSNHYFDLLPPFQYIDPTQSLVTNDDNWRVCMLYVSGKPVIPNVAKCLRTAAAVKDVKGLWNAYISYYAPGKRLPPSSSLTAGLLRYHLTISADDGSSMSVSSSPYTFKVNEGVLYDSTFETDFNNDSQNEWLVLLTLDIIRPLKGFASGFNNLVLGLVARHRAIEAGIARASINFDRE